jgi:hypothetical protein
LAYALQDYNVDTPTSFDNICELEKDFSFLEKLKNSDYANNNVELIPEEDHSVASVNDITPSADSVAHHHSTYADCAEDLLELKRDIYESIQRPIAETLENIADVVNNVIREIVENHDVHGEIWKISPENRKRLQEIIGISLRNLKETQMENNNKSIVDVIRTNMDDAYMSNVAEELLDGEVCNRLIKMETGDEIDLNSNKTSNVTKSLEDKKSNSIEIPGF